jgi:adenylate cyclase
VGDEIERRFLVDDVPSGTAVESDERLEQGYLAIDGAAVVRVRRSERGWVLCIKGGSGLVRTEVERDLDVAEGEQLWELTLGRRIGKLRQRIRLDHGLVAELDTFDIDLDGLQIVEVEFDSEAAAAAFVPPAWFGRELTDDPRWSNVALATTGRPDTGTGSSSSASPVSEPSERPG